MLVNSCCVLRGMEVRKVWYSKSDLQGHSVLLATMPFDSPHMIPYYFLTRTRSMWCEALFAANSAGYETRHRLLFIATMSLSCTVSEILSHISQNLKKSRDTLYIPFGVIYHALVSTPVYQSANEIFLKCLSSSFPKIWLGQNLKTGHVTPTTPHLGWFMSS